MEDIFMIDREKRMVTIPNPRYIDLNFGLLWRRDLTEGVRINDEVKMVVDHKLLWEDDYIFFTYGRNNEDNYALTILN